MITFEDIQSANSTIKTTDIKGKAYAEVNQRIKAFRMLYPQGEINTIMLSNDADETGEHMCVFRATAGYVDDSGEFRYLASGTAFEREFSSHINRTSYIEVCETSAVGRCLGMIGLGIDTSIASAEEMQNALAQQEEKTTISKDQMARMKAMYSEEELKQMGKELGIKKLSDMPVEYFLKKEQEYINSPEQKKLLQEPINGIWG